MYRRRVILLSFLVTLYPLVVLGFYYQPGVLPRDYQASEEVDIRVNALESRKTLLPYDYYDIPICPNAAVSRFSENLGEILSGERTESSLYRVSTLVNENCKVLCERTFTDDELALLTTKIKDEYRVNMELDNLPLVRTSADSSEDNGVAVYEKGFPIGSVGTNEGVLSYPGVVYVNNHLTLNIYYHQHESAEKGADATMRIVGFEVEASSVRLDTQTQRIKNGKMDVCTPARDNDVSTSRQAISDPNGSQIQLNPADRTIVFVYNVRWHKSDTTWVHRWDIYLKMADSNVHWFSIAIAVVIVAFLSGTIAMMLTKTVDSDIQRYNTEYEDVEAEGLNQTQGFPSLSVGSFSIFSTSNVDSGWKLLHADVFRPPYNGAWFATLAGSGAQLFSMAYITLVFSTAGLLSPAWRGSLIMALLIVFAAMGIIAGSFSTWIFTSFKLLNWKKQVFFTAVFYPGIVFMVSFFLNLLVWQAHSTKAIPFADMIMVVVLWFGVSVPLVYLGGSFVMRQGGSFFDVPLKYNPAPRRIGPPPVWYQQPNVMCMAGGSLVFLSCCIQVFFILKSIWFDQFYYVFGVLLLVGTMLVIISAEVAIIVCYTQLRNEDYRWWWTSFWSAGSSGLYLFIASFFYYLHADIRGFIPTVIFFGNMLLTSFTFSLVTGTVGFIGTYFFLKQIYGRINRLLD